MTERATQWCLHTPSQPCTARTGCTHSVIPGDNLTACRIGRIRYAASTFCLSALPFSAIESDSDQGAVIHFCHSCRYFTHPHFSPLSPSLYPSLCYPFTYPSTRPPTPIHHRPSIYTVRRRRTHQPSILVSPFLQLRVCLMTGASSNKPAVYQYLRTQGMSI
jgi:hypothetical protein